VWLDVVGIRQLPGIVVAESHHIVFAPHEDAERQLDPDSAIVWADDLDDGSFDAVLSATAIHWVQPNEVVAMYRTLARLLRRGGVFANADHMPVSSEPIAARSQNLLDAWQSEQLQEGEDYYVCRDALRGIPSSSHSSRRVTAASPPSRPKSRRRWRSTARPCSWRDSQPQTSPGGISPTRSSSRFVSRRRRTPGPLPSRTRSPDLEQSRGRAATDDAALPLIAAAGYLAAHATTTRSQLQTFEIARRLYRGERLYDDESGEI
jgi:hypothetical protein